MVSTHFLLKKIDVVVLTLLFFPAISFCQLERDTFNIAVHHQFVLIDETAYPVTQFTDELGRIWFRKGFIESDGDEGDRVVIYRRSMEIIGIINYTLPLEPADTIAAFAGFRDVNPENLENVFFAEVFYAIIGDLFFKETGKVLFGENTIIAAHEYVDFQSEPIEFEFSFLNLPIVDGSNTLYYCHFVSSDINGLQLVRRDSSTVDRKNLRPVEVGLKELREAKGLLHCAQFRRPDLLFADGVRYYFVPECIAYGEPKLSPEEKKKFGKIQGPMIQLYAIGSFNKKPNFFQWVKSLFK